MEAMLLQEFIEAPSKAESILDKLTTEQLQMIEATLYNVKKRKLEKSVTPPSPPSESEEETAMEVDPIIQTNMNTSMSSNNTSSKVNNHSIIHPTATTTTMTPPPLSTTTTTTTTMPSSSSASTSVAAAIATALAAAMTNAVATTLKQQQSNNTIPTSSNPTTNTATSNTTTTTTTTDHIMKQQQQQQKIKSPIEPMAEVKDGVEWVSFVYSHNRVMKKYTIRTDLENIALDQIDDKFKADNCVYPRANLPKDQYKGNRWAYETECNVLGWKLAWLNMSEISGKRGLIQRAVDSYRNRYPSMRSRRVARQAKLMNGTLRKRKQRGDEEDALIELMSSLTNNNHQTSHHQHISTATSNPSSSSSSSVPKHMPDHHQLQCSYVPPTSLDTATIKPSNHPKTIAMEDLATGTRCRIKINVETVSLDYIPHDFRLANSPYPRYLRSNISANRPRAIEETICNELAWKLAWLNPKTLAGKKNMLQRAIDLYRSKFMPSMPPRKYSSRQPILATLLNNPLFQQLAASSSSLTSANGTTSTPIPINATNTNTTTTTTLTAYPVNTTSTSTSTSTSSISTISNPSATPTPLTASALSAQNAQYKKLEEEEGNIVSPSPTMSCISGTTATLDFTDCLSLADENCLLSSSPLTTSTDLIQQQQNNDNNTTDMMFPSCSPLLSSCFDESSTTISSSSSGTNSVVCTPSPPVNSDLFNLAMDEMYDVLMLPPTAINDSYMSDHHNSNSVINNNTMSSSSKNYDPLLCSPSLPSSTLQSDLLIKLENVDNFADQLLEPFF
ncbi:unnamed protein product [Cunninghamella echinulata]